MIDCPSASALRPALLLGLAALLPARAEAPAPLTTFPGEFRGFSPDGRSAVACTPEGVSVYDARSWKALGTLPVAFTSSPRAVLVDNLRHVAVLHRGPKGQTVLDLLDFSGQPRPLAHETGVLHRAITLGEDGEIRLLGVSSYFTNRSVAIRSNRGIVLELDHYETTAYTCTISQYLTTLAGIVDRNLTAASAPAVRKACDLDFDFPRSVNRPATFSLDQSDFAVWWRTSYTTNDSHPATGVKDDEIQSKSGSIRFPGLEGYRFAADKADADLRQINAPGFHLLSGNPWRVTFPGTARASFDLVQLEAPGFTPRRVSPDGRVVAFGDGRSTRIYEADVVTDPFANLDPDILVDVVMGKIEAHLRNEEYAQALPYFERLARTGRALPESFHFYEIDTLERSGRKVEARAKAEAYLRKYGKKGKYYAKVIAVMTRI